MENTKKYNQKKKKQKKGTYHRQRIVTIQRMPPVNVIVVPSWKSGAVVRARYSGTENAGCTGV